MLPHTVLAHRQAAFDKLKTQIALVSEQYGQHRPLIQRLLTIGFVCYALGSTVSGLTGSSAKPRKPRRQPSAKEKALQETNKKRVVKSSRHQRVAVDAVFFAKLKHLLRIVIPGWRTKEALMLGLHSVFLVMTTMLSLYVADLDGRIVSSLVRSQLPTFLLNLAKWLAIAVPACYCNAMLEYLQSKLATAYRSRCVDMTHIVGLPSVEHQVPSARLTENVLSQYLEDGADGKDGQIFYKMGNLDDRIKNADQMITVDIQRFANQLAAIYSNIAKPVLDVVLYNYQLSQNVGAEGLVVLTILVQASARLLKALTPPFGTYAAYEATLEGE